MKLTIPSTFEVTQAHIDAAIEGRGYYWGDSCPVARAVRPFLPEGTNICVGMDGAIELIATGGNTDRTLGYVDDDTVRSVIRKFDIGSARTIAPRVVQFTPVEGQ